MMYAKSFADQRGRMIRRQLKARGIRDGLVLAAMAGVPREHFVDEPFQSRTYDDGPLPIGDGQTISQPYVVALMAEALQLEDGSHVLEIGTGSGYGAAILAQIAGQVTTIERIDHHAARAETRFQDLGYDNIRVVRGDGCLGYEDHAPYDAIVATACGDAVPPALKQQLKNGGRLVMPVSRKSGSQRLVKLIKTSACEFEETDLGRVSFVRLVPGIKD